MGFDPGLDPAAAGAAAPGWYGKLSTLGDFAARRLPDAAVQALDCWLSEVVSGSRRELGDDWLQCYLASPLQRFVLGPGLLPAGGGGAAGTASAAGAPWWFGALMPSCDRVGRYFPLVVLQQRSAPPAERFALDHLELWWRRVGEAMLETLSDDVDVERFDRVLTEFPSWPTARESPGWAALLAAGPTGECQLPAACTPGGLAQGLASAAWRQKLEGSSLWWSWRPQDGQTTCRIVSGLPSVAVFTAMLGTSA